MTMIESNDKKTNTEQINTPPFFWLACIVILTIARYHLGGYPGMQLSIHQSIVDSILAGNDWGRQALVGNLDNPFLPTVALLAANVVCRITGGNPGLLLCAVSQAVVMTLFLRLAVMRRQWILAPLFLVLSVLIPFLRNLLLSLDPNWSSAVPAAAAIFYLVRWEELDTLRDLLLVAVCIGLFAFAGPGAIIIGFCTIPLLAEQYRLKKQGSWQEHRGIRTILWAPLLYCIAIWLLWNSLIFNDVFFGLRDAAHRMSVKILQPKTSFDCVVFLPMIITLAILSLKGDRRQTAKCLLPACIVIPLVSYISARYGIGPAALGPLAYILVLSTVTLCFISSAPSRNVRFAWYAATTCTVVIACFFGTVASKYEISEDPDKKQEETFKPGEIADAPNAQEIIDFIDQYWPNSRVILVGSRLPALYPDPEAKRFVSKLNFSEQDFLAQAENEQMHLLIPPPDGRFYPIQNSVLSDIYKNGRDWLFLEKVFPNDWQLWRSTVPPKGESKIMREKTDNQPIIDK